MEHHWVCSSFNPLQWEWIFKQAKLDCMYCFVTCTNVSVQFKMTTFKMYRPAFSDQGELCCKLWVNAKLTAVAEVAVFQWHLRSHDGSLLRCPGYRLRVTSLESYFVHKVSMWVFLMSETTACIKQYVKTRMAYYIRLNIVVYIHWTLRWQAYPAVHCDKANLRWQQPTKAEGRSVQSGGRCSTLKVLTGSGAAIWQRLSVNSAFILLT